MTRHVSKCMSLQDTCASHVSTCMGFDLCKNGGGGGGGGGEGGGS